MGNHNTAEFWEYDTRVGRRWNTDPVVKPWESSYACFANNPIWYSDVNGDDGTQTGSGNGYMTGDLNNVVVRCSRFNADKKDDKDESDDDKKSAGGGGGAGGAGAGANSKHSVGEDQLRKFSPLLAKQGIAVENNGGGGNGAQGGGDGLGNRGMNTANDWLGYAGYLEAGLSGVQIGMIEYRQSLSINSKIGTFSNFSTTYRALGTTRKVLGGAATYVGAPLNTYMDYKSMKSGEIGAGRFSYRTAGTAVGIGVGAYFGPISGAVIGGGFWAGEKMYDGYMYWQTKMSIFLTNFENGLKNGWVPGR